MPQRATLYFNSRSRQGAVGLDQARRLLMDGGIEVVESHTFANAQRLMWAVETDVRRKMPLIIVGGGDGTLSAAAQYLSGKESILGVLPAGTGNAFARDLGISTNIEAACGAILNGKVAKVDVGIIGDRKFLNVATIGLSTRIAMGLQPSEKRILGRWAYIMSLSRALATIRPFRVRLELASGVFEFDSLQVVIGNGRFHAGPFPVAPDASITGGWLSIYALASSRKSALLKLAIDRLGGDFVKFEEVKSFRVHSGRLSTEPSKRITIDGETCLRAPVDFGIAAQSLKVMTPIDFAEDY
ncbi:MAG: YegS/Rv2252/BmrU family lipid kinase [Fimbriimonas sp.]|nr:YegS/Rv2252/BmrU family lipid kinase [Fimbriimonas sp.]